MNKYGMVYDPLDPSALNKERGTINIAGYEYPVLWDMNVEGFTIVGYLPPDNISRFIFVLRSELVPNE
jgi:hypothetical protein